jgi:ribonucleoside-triphosphate reductase
LGQSLFTNITIDFTVPDDLKDQTPMRNNKHLFEGLEDKELLEKITIQKKMDKQEAIKN